MFLFKNIFFILFNFLILFLFSFVFGNTTGNQLTGLNEQIVCIKDKYYIIGLDKVRKFTNVTYLINTKENLKINGLIHYQVLDDKKNIIESGFGNQKINLFFPNVGNYILKVDIKEKNCTYNLEKKIEVYDKIIFYLGIKNDKLSWVKPLITKGNNILFIDLSIPKKGYYTWDEFLKEITTYIYYLKESEVLLIYYPNFSYILDGLVKVQNLYNINFSKKKIYIIGEITLLEKKILLKYMKVLNTNTLGIVKPIYLLDFLENLVNNKKIEGYVSFFKITNISENKYFILSSIINKLIFSGFPSNLLSLVLLVPLVLLIITFFRQMIGFHVFGVYNPLIFSLILVIFGIKFSLILFLVGIIAVLISKSFIKKIYLLYSSKWTLFYIIYILTLILSVYLLGKIGFKITSSSVFKNILIIFPLISAGIVVNKLLPEDISIFSKKFLISLIEFLILSGVGYLIFTNIYLQNLFLVYPELIILILIINILIGRFTGLQLFEYFRFMPLIKKHLEE